MAIRALPAYRTSLSYLGENNPTHKANIDFCLKEIEAILAADHQAYRAALLKKIPAQVDPNRLNVQLENALPPEMRFWARLHEEMDAGANNPRTLEVVAKMVFKAAKASGLLPSEIVYKAISALQDKE